MKKGIVLASVLFTTLLAVSQFATAADNKKTNTSNKQTRDTFTQGKQGEAKDALEKSAGKKTDDVKVPDVPKPTPVKN